MTSPGHVSVASRGLCSVLIRRLGCRMPPRDDRAHPGVSLGDQREHSTTCSRLIAPRHRRSSHGSRRRLESVGSQGRAGADSRIARRRCGAGENTAATVATPRSGSVTRHAANPLPGRSLRRALRGRRADPLPGRSWRRALRGRPRMVEAVSDGCVWRAAARSLAFARITHMLDHRAPDVCGGSYTPGPMESLLKRQPAE